MTKEAILEILLAILLFLSAMQNKEIDLDNRALKLPKRVTEGFLSVEKPRETVAEIDPRTIVGLICYFRTPDSEELVPITQASGVIIHQKGYLLTSRHVVDLSDEPEYQNYQFDHCQVGYVFQEIKLYTDPEIIDRVRPSAEIPFLPYAAKLVFLPKKEAGMSEAEIKWLDFALLQITGLVRGSEIFGFTNLPENFPTAETVEDFSLLKEGAEVITYGVPAYFSQLRRSRNLFLVGSYGTLERIFFGKQYFQKTPLILETKMELNPGRSGSPVFWQGKVIGIAQSVSKKDKFISLSVAIPAIKKVLRQQLNFDF